MPVFRKVRGDKKLAAGPGRAPDETPRPDAIWADFFLAKKHCFFELITSSIEKKLELVRTATRALRGAFSSMRVYGAPRYLLVVLLVLVVLQVARRALRRP